MGCLHFGAHLDLADSWAGERLLSTCALARITELPNLAAANVAHIGARNSMNPKDYIDLAKARGIRFYPMFEIFERGIDSVIEEAVVEGLGRHRRAISQLQLQRHGRLGGAGRDGDRARRP